MTQTWSIEHKSDTYPDGDGGSTYAEWWIVTDGKTEYRCDYLDDAELLCNALNASTKGEPS